jgi:putative membrane protein
MILDKKIPLSYWFSIIKWDMIIVFCFSTIVYILSLFLPTFNVPVSIGAFLGTAIALVLSFKLSQSYDRWWEARKIWGAIVNDSRSLIVQTKNFAKDISPKDLQTIANRQIAWCFVFGQKLRELDHIKALEKYLPEETNTELKQHSNIPLALIDKHSADFTALLETKKINDFQYIQLDNTLVRLVESMGKAERIKNTVFPRHYRLALHLFIYIFLICLSFALSDLFSYVKIPLLMLISLPFFLLEKVAFTIQDPFENKPTDISVTAISHTIKANLKDVSGQVNYEEKEHDEDWFYIM